MQAARGGMGSHKHGTSGRGGPSPGAKQARARDANRIAEEEQKLRPKTDVYKSVQDLMKSRRKP